MFTSRLLATLGLVTALTAAAITPAAAQAAMGDPVRKQVREACEADFKALCEGIRPGGGRVLQCLEEHREQVSPACISALEQAKTARSGAQ
jgi:hypothetical protein